MPRSEVRWIPACLASMLCVLVAPVCAQVERVAYTVEYRAEVRDRAFVTATFAGRPEAGALEVQIPTWSPGAYEIKPFFKRIGKLTATDAKGVALEVTRKDDLTWQIARSESWPVTAFYDRLDQNEGLSDTGGPTPRKKDYVAFNPTDTFVYAVGRKTVPHEVFFKVPDHWLVAMALPRDDGGRRFSAPDYDTIADAPVELGHLTIHRFKVGDAIYSIVLDFRDKRFALMSFEAMLRRIIRYQVGMWGGKAPYAAYEFHVHDGPGFGLEHLTSTTLSVPTDPGEAFRSIGPGVIDDLCAHEYFHLWNVKRLRPRQLGPFDYTKAVRTKALWLSEGVTDYYADVTCWRTRLWNDGKFLSSMREQIQQLQSTPRRVVESVEGSSWAAFDRGYTGIGTEEQVDYYNKGKLIGLCLDLLIREKTQGQRTLDDVMRGLYAKYALPKPGFDDEGLAQDFSEIAGFDLASFFQRYVSGTAELPFAETLATIGVRCIAGQVDRKAASSWWESSGLAIDHGVLVVKTPSKVLARLGISAGDQIVSVNDAPLPQASRPADLLPSLVPANAGAAIVKVRRGEKEMTVTTPFPLEHPWDLEQIHDPSAAQRRRFEEFRADRYSALVPDGPTLETIGLK